MDVPLWAFAVSAFAAAVSVAAFVVTLLARGDSKRSALAADVAARAAVDSADAARREVDEAKRANDRNDETDKRERNERIRLALTMREEPDGRFRFHNTGSDQIVGLTFAEPGISPAEVVPPFSLAPDSTSEVFTLDQSSGAQKQLRVTWDGLDHPATIAVRRRGRMWVS
jgi:hypothetical protein